MYKNLIKNLNSFVNFSEEELMIFLSEFNTKSVKKNEIFLKAGTVCNYVSFVNKGLIRYYYIIEGKEQTSRIFFENDWAGEYASFIKRSPSVVDLEALEDTELFTLSYDSVQKLYDKSKTFERFGRLMAEFLFTEYVTRAAIFLRKSPNEKYIELVNKQPELFNRVPLKHIATILGIEPESLSRIRKRMSGR